MKDEIRLSCIGFPVRSLDGAIEMYQRGMNARAIAIALGFESTSRPGDVTANGMQRVSRLLEAAGLRKIRRRK